MFDEYAYVPRHCESVDVDLVAVHHGPGDGDRGTDLGDDITLMFDTLKQLKHDQRNLPHGELFYILKFADDRIKIGITINMAVRMRAYRTSNPDVRIIKMFLTSKSKLIESIVLDRFGMHRIGSSEVLQHVDVERVIDYATRLHAILHETDV